MRAVVQRVTRAKVIVENKIVGEIGRGLLVLLGVRNGDAERDAEWLAEKCVNLRIFENEEGKFHFSLLDISGDILVVSQFTLYGDCRRGRRPSFTEAASPELAEKLYNRFIDILKQKRLKVETGIFAARMSVEIHNDGPVTLILNSEDKLQ